VYCILGFYGGVCSTIRNSAKFHLICVFIRIKMSRFALEIDWWYKISTHKVSEPMG
jgi:hypothetical protein